MEIKNKIIEIGKIMFNEGLVASTWGNISIKFEDSIYITPSGMEYNFLEPNDIVVTDLEGNIKEGKRKPSSEMNLHLEIYKRRKDVGAIVHTHSLYASSYAVARKPIKPLIEDMAQVIGGEVSVASYALPGSYELAKNSADALSDKGAVLLANHGVVGVGVDINEAYKACLLVEKTAHIGIASMSLGMPHSLSDEDVKWMRNAYLTVYGQKF